MPSESSERVNRRAFLQVAAAGAVTGAAVAGGIPEIAVAQTSRSEQKSRSDQGGGHLYMQTNETQNSITHWSANGTITEVERIPTGGVGSGLLSPIYHTSRPNTSRVRAVLFSRRREYSAARQSPAERSRRSYDELVEADVRPDVTV